jgi:hypothetical protein
MNKVLKVDSTRFYVKTVLFLIGFIGLLANLYFLYSDESTKLVIILVAASFFIPWSFFSAIGERDIQRKQFQKMTIEDECIVFEHLPLQGGRDVSVQIDFKNIKSFTVKGMKLHVLFVQRFEWEGDACDYITPSGFVPKLQVFSLALKMKKRRAIIELLESKGLINKHKK